MRNRHPGPCYVCGKLVPAQGGHFERNAQGRAHYTPKAGRWRLRHPDCRPADAPKP